MDEETMGNRAMVLAVADAVEALIEVLLARGVIAAGEMEAALQAKAEAAKTEAAAAELGERAILLRVAGQIDLIRKNVAG